MTLLECVLAAALAFMAGRLILWTALARGRDAAVTLEAVRLESGGVADYTVASLGLACRGDVLVWRADATAIRQRSLLHRLQGLEPHEVVALLKSEGFRAELMPPAATWDGAAGSPAPSGFAALSLRRAADLLARLKRNRGASSGDAQ